MLSIMRFSKFMLFIFCVMLLSNCTNKVAIENHLQVNKKLTSPYSMPAAAYLALAKKQVGTEQQTLYLMAAGRLIYDGQWRQGLIILAQTGTLPPELADEKVLLQAKVDLIKEQPREAIAKLASIHSMNSLPTYYQVQYYEMLAYAYQSTGNSLESVVERIKLDNVLPDEQSKSNNRRTLWLSLTTLPLAELDTLTMEAHDGTVLKGWMQLALISRQQYDNPQAMLSQIEHWQSLYPNHPANPLLPSPLDSVAARLYPPPGKIALLLPLSGPLSGPGNAIKDGFMAGYDARPARGALNVSVYDTNAGSVASLYERALSEGADYVVGPLSKADVTVVAAMNHPVPTLLLNDLEGHTKNNAWQFGLSPGNEARQVAAKARKRGLTHALVIAPMGPWGADVVNAFTDQWQASGGDIVDTLSYGPHDDMNASIRNFLHVSDSEARGKQMQHVLGHNIESTPSRRQDFDVIFLLAYPSKARQIMPLLNYYYAGNVPVYATSSVYSGSANSMKDRDLDGIIFCDMPWVFNHQMGTRNWPEQFNSYNRLYALGMDSFSLSNQLNQLILFPALGISDKSGVLYLSGNQQIARILAFGQFRQGLPQMLGENK